MNIRVYKGLQVVSARKVKPHVVGGVHWGEHELWAQFPTEKKSKYSNEKTIVDGHEFMSKREAKYYSELKLLQRAGEIFDLVLQPKFPIVMNGQVICNVIADFSFEEKANLGRRVVVDVKGFWTDVSRLKWKMAKASYPSHDWRIIK